MNRLGLDRYSAVYMGAIFIVVFGIWTPKLFLTMSTVHSVASAQAVGAIMAIAVIVPLSAGVFDLSIGSVVNLSAVLVAIKQNNDHWSIWASILLALAVSFVIGVINGFLVVKLHIDAFIATLATATIIGAVQVIVSGQTQPLQATSRGWTALTETEVGGFQVIIFYLVALALFFWWLLDHTPFGRRLGAVGGNREAARLSGIRVDNYIWFSLICSSTLCGVAGVLYCSLSGPSLTFGAALLLPAYAAAFLGSTQIKPGRFNIWGSMIAVYVLAIGIQGLQYVTGVQWLGDMFNGVSLVLAVGFAAMAPRLKARRAQRAAVEERLKGVLEATPEKELVSS